MEQLTDQELLRAYGEGQAEAAFAELTSRYVDFVYSAAARMVRDTHLAKDVTQGVFLALAKNAGQLAAGTVLAGWLHRTARNIAAQTIRTEVRRRAREQEAAAMSNGTEAGWQEIAPELDEALDRLSDSDRDAILSRYFNRRSAREIGAMAGISEEAAQKRVNRAVERLRGFLVERSVPTGGSGLAALLAAHGVQAAPAGLAAQICLAAGMATAASGTGTMMVITMSTAQKLTVGVAFALAVGTGIYKAREAGEQRARVQELEARQSALHADLAALQDEKELLERAAAQAKETSGLADEERQELLRLRGKSSTARTDAQEIGRLRSELDASTRKVPDFMTNAMASGLATAEAWKRKDSAARLARMKEALRLTDAQEQAIHGIMTNHIQRQSQMVMDLMTGKVAKEEMEGLKGKGRETEESEVLAQLTSEQLAGYSAFKESERRVAAETAAESDLRQLPEDLQLAQHARNEIKTGLVKLYLEPEVDSANVERTIELQERRLEEKVRLLSRFAPPEKIAAYRDGQMARILMQSNALKMVIPSKAN